MAEDFDNLSSKITSLIRKQDLNANIIEKFFQYTNQIIDQGILNNPISDKTDKFLNETVPSVGSILLSSFEMNSAQLQFSITLMNCLNNLALWGMLNGKENLVNNLFCLTNSNSSYYVRNSINHPNIFIEKVHYFLSSLLWDQLNDKMTTPKDFQVPMLFSIYAFLFQYFSSCDRSDEIVSGVLNLLIQRFLCDFVNSMDDDDDDDEISSKCQPSTLVIIIESLNKIFSQFDVLDNLPIFMKFLSRLAKSESFEKKISALSVLNSYALSENEQIVEYFSAWKEETDVVSSLIKMDLSFEILRASKDLIMKVIQDDELFDFLIKVKSWFIVKRHFSFHLIAQTLVERFEIDTINDLVITKLPSDSIDIEFLCALLIEIFKSNKEDLLAGCEDIVDLIFKIGEDDLSVISPIMFNFFKEMKDVDQNPSITPYRVNVLARYIQMLKEDDFVDQICFFLADQIGELYRISLLQQTADSFDEIQAVLEETLNKSKQRYISINYVSEAMIHLIYILILFRNIEFFVGDPYHIHVKEPSNYEFFDFALSALMSCNDQFVADLAIELFSQFFSQTSFLSESITILYNFCISYLQDEIDQMLKCRILKLIYKVLVDMESDYELIDFENVRRNHKNDTKGKDFFIVLNGQTEIEIYMKPNSTAEQLINHIAMRLHGTKEMIKVTDFYKNDINPTCLAHKLNQPLNVVCLNDKYSRVNYSSASYSLWKHGFTTILLEILDNSSSQPEIIYVAKRLLSFLPSDQSIMSASIDDYLQMIVDTQSDEKFTYLLHCVNHFPPNNLSVISSKADKVWNKFRLQTKCFPAVFEFCLRVLNEDDHQSMRMFLGGRIFRSLYLHEKKAYKIATELYIEKITKFLFVSEINLLKMIIKNCDDEEWPYLRKVIGSFGEYMTVFSACIEEVSDSQLTHRFIIKLLAIAIKETSYSEYTIRPFFEVIKQLDDCDADELIDVIKVLNYISVIVVREYFLIHQDELDKIIILAFTKGSLNAESIVLNLCAQFGGIQSQSTSDILIQFFDQEFDFWNYNSNEHQQNKLGIGLKNLDSTCYMNSLLQVFNRIPAFLNEVFASSDSNLQSFQWVLASLQKSSRDFIDPSKFITEWKGWNKGQTDDQKDEQFDVAELYHFVMQNCPKSAQNLFMGEQISKINGENGFEKEVSEPFFSLSVKVKGFTNLVQSIYSMIEPEIVANFNDGSQKIVTKSIRITHCPNILVVQLERFEFDQQNQMKVKNDQRFEFPEHLNISPLLQTEKEVKSACYSLHSIICHSDGYYALLHEDKKYHKVATSIYNANDDDDDEKWIRIQNQTITELENGYENEAFENACLLFYFLDDFLTENDGVPPEVKIEADLCDTIQKENESFGMIQALFSVEVAKFLQNSVCKEPIMYYLFNIVMHGSSEFKDYINYLTRFTVLQDAIEYIDQNFGKFIAIFEHQEVPEVLIDPFVKFSCNLMEKRSASQILNKILDVLSSDKIAECAIMPLLTLVYSHLKENTHQDDLLDIINKLVGFIVNCINKNLTPNVKIDNVLSSLTELLKCGNISGCNKMNFKLIEENYQFISDHLSSIKSLNDFVEQAVKCDLLNAAFYAEFSSKI